MNDTIDLMEHRMIPAPLKEHESMKASLESIAIGELPKEIVEMAKDYLLKRAGDHKVVAGAVSVWQGICYEIGNALPRDDAGEKIYQTFIAKYEDYLRAIVVNETPEGYEGFTSADAAVTFCAPHSDPY